MGKFDGVLLVSDFDDTLYDSHHRVPERNRRALDYFRSQGGRFTVATGRARRTFAPYHDLVPLDAPVVLSNGSAIYDFSKNEMLEQTFLPPSAPADFSAILAQFPSVGAEVYHAEDIYAWNPNYITEAHMKKVGGGYTVLPFDQMPTPWTKAILQQERNVLRPVQQWLLERWGDRYEAIFSNAYHRQGQHQGGLCGQGGGHAGHPAGEPLLRGRQPERPVHAPPFRHPLCPRQLRPRGEGLGGQSPLSL